MSRFGFVEKTNFKYVILYQETWPSRFLMNTQNSLHSLEYVLCLARLIMNSFMPIPNTAVI